MTSVIEACRERLGPPPRSLSPEDVRRLRLVWWPLIPLPFDSLFRVYLAQKTLRERGEVVWGYVLQANQGLWAPGFEPSAATVLFGGPELDDLGSLVQLAELLYSLKGTSPKDPELRAAAALTHEYRRKLCKEVPRSLTGGRTVYCSDLMIHRGHLPGSMTRSRLRKPFLPLLVNPSETRSVMVLPAYFWPRELVESWGQD